MNKVLLWTLKPCPHAKICHDIRSKRALIGYKSVTLQVLYTILSRWQSLRHLDRSFKGNRGRIARERFETRGSARCNRRASMSRTRPRNYRDASPVSYAKCHIKYSVRAFRRYWTATWCEIIKRQKVVLLRPVEACTFVIKILITQICIRRSVLYWFYACDLKFGLIYHRIKILLFRAQFKFSFRSNRLRRYRRRLNRKIYSTFVFNAWILLL